jgi:hypothetical protein
MAPRSTDFAFREIQKLLSSQLHEANETLRIAKMRNLSKTEQDQASEAVRVALDRWNALVTKREVPDYLKEWDGIGTPPGPRRSDSGA